MSTFQETRPFQIVGGPHDGTEIDVRDDEDEVQRVTDWGSVARYVRTTMRRFDYIGLKTCPKCHASLVACRLCGAEWCLDHQVKPLVCPGCGKRPNEGS